MFDGTFFLALRDFLTPTPAIQSVTHPDGESLTIQAPEGYEITVLEGHEAHRPNHTFTDLRDFCVYLTTRAKPETTDVVIDASQAVAHFDSFDKTAPVVACQLLHHPDWTAWTKVLDRAMTAEQLFDFCRTIPATLPAIPGRSGRGETIPQWESLQSELSKLKLSTTEDYSAEIDARGMVTVSGATSKTTISANLPPTLSARIPIYDEVYVVDEQEVLEDELAVYDMEILLSVKFVKGKGLFFTLRCPRREQAKRQALRDAVGWVRHLLDENWMVGVGTAKTTTVTLPLAANTTPDAAAA